MVIRTRPPSSLRGGNCSRSLRLWTERRTDPEDGAESQWFDNPKFQHYANQQESMKAMKTDSTAVVSLRTKLLAATTEEEVYEILKGED